MTYLGAGRYFPAAVAPRSTAMVHGVGFRLPGSLDTVSARLERAASSADVQIGPKLALWPRGSGIESRFDCRANPASRSVLPAGRAKVTLGLEPIEVTFERAGNVLHAVVPRAASPTMGAASGRGRSIRAYCSARLSWKSRSSRGPKPPSASRGPSERCARGGRRPRAGPEASQPGQRADRRQSN